LFHHYGPEVILGEGESFTLLRKHAAERLAVSSAWMRIGLLSVTDHLMDGYIERLAFYAEEQQGRSSR